MDISYIKKFEPIEGKWYVNRELGSGSFGTVYEIERRDFTKMKSALKVISIPSMQSEVQSYREENYDLDEDSVTSYFYGFVEEFIKEFDIMSKLRGNTNVVNIEDYDVKEKEGEFGWDIFIRMELLTPMNKFFAGREIKREDVIKLGMNIAKALEVCRKFDIIHRDIKPSNIFVSEIGEFKLGDFGVARTLERTSSGLSKKGTYTYMAPEVFKNEPYNETVDIYSLGIVMYKLLNNNLEPFRTERTHAAEEEALGKRLRGEKMPKPANADEEFSKIILKACAYNPKERYQSATELISALEALGEVNVSIAPIAPSETAAAEEDRDKTIGIFDEPSGEENKTVGIFDESSEEENKTVGIFDVECKEESEEAEEVAEEKSLKKNAMITSLYAICAAVLGILVAAVILPMFQGVNSSEVNTSLLEPRCTDYGKYGYIDETGEWIIEPQFDMAYIFTDTDIALVYFDGKYGYINGKGEYVVEPKFDELHGFTDNGLACVCVDGKYGYINESGEYVVEPQFDMAGDFFENGLAQVVCSEAINYINKFGEIQFDYVWGFTDNGLSVIEINEKYGYINEFGEIVIEPKFDWAYHFSTNGLADVKIGEKCGYINANGEFVIEPQFDTTYQFEDNGLAWVELNGESFQINERGERVE